MSLLPGLPKKKDYTPRVGVIIQARMTSKRFPGKSTAPLMGKPVVQHVWERAALIRPVDVVIVAVPDDPASEPIETLAEAENIKGWRGSEDDVLTRFYDAANHYKLDIVVRVTGDCPFLNPRISSEVLQLLLWRKLDYASNIYPDRTYPRGLDTEAFTFDALEAAHVSTTMPYDREHVTPWLQRTKGIRRGQTQQSVDASEDNWCVDEPEDIERLEALFKEKPKDGKLIMAGVSIWD